MKLHINGTSVELTNVDTIYSLLAHYGVEKKIVVVEQNGQILERSVYETTPVAAGDRIEIVHFVGGG